MVPLTDSSTYRCVCVTEVRHLPDAPSLVEEEALPVLKDQVADGLPQHLPPEHPAMDPASGGQDHDHHEPQRGHEDNQAVDPHGADGQHTPPEAEGEVPARGKRAFSDSRKSVDYVFQSQTLRKTSRPERAADFLI